MEFPEGLFGRDGGGGLLLLLGRGRLEEGELSGLLGVGGVEGFELGFDFLDVWPHGVFFEEFEFLIQVLYVAGIGTEFLVDRVLGFFHGFENGGYFALGQVYSSLST